MTRRTRLEVELGARDNASRTVDDLADKVDRLEDGDKVIALRGQVDHAEREIRRLERQLGRIDRYDGEQIELIVDARDKARAKLDAAQAKLRELDGTTARVDVEVDDSQLDDAIGKIDDLLGGRLGGLGGGGALVSRLGVGGAIAAGFVLAGDAAADAAISVDNLAKLTGDTVENASRLQGIMATAGVESTDLQDILLQMGGVLADDAELARQLGLNMNDGRTLGERFVQVVEALGDRFTDAGERSLVAARLFGEEGVRQVNAVTAAYPDLQQAVDDYAGAVYSATDVEQAREYKRALSEVRGEFSAIGAEIGTSVLPGLAGVLAGLRDIDEWVASTDTGGRGLFQQAGDALSSILFGAAQPWQQDLQDMADASEDAAKRSVAAWADVPGSIDAVRDAVRDAAGELGDAATAAEQVRDVFVDQGWQQYLATLRNIKGELEGAPGLFDDLVAAAERGLAIGAEANAAREAARRQVGDDAPGVSFRVAGGARPYLTGPTVAPNLHVGDVIIHNPPGTPASTADQQRRHDQRNGHR